ncbi:unnamed protein product [Sphagnum jensenii]|uniref:Uncharacterized protein n=1 Tax=Sphagnum jensenii TaxID=128206 RepID=A0ABP0VIJ8_9BRYO
MQILAVLRIQADTKLCDFGDKFNLPPAARRALRNIWAGTALRRRSSRIDSYISGTAAGAAIGATVARGGAIGAPVWMCVFTSLVCRWISIGGSRGSGSMHCGDRLSGSIHWRGRG